MRFTNRATIARKICQCTINVKYFLANILYGIYGFGVKPMEGRFQFAYSEILFHNKIMVKWAIFFKCHFLPEYLYIYT